MDEIFGVFITLYYLQIEQSDKGDKMLIYKATSATTGKVYIGQTTQTLQERINQHNSHAYSYQYNYHFHNAIRKYSPEDFNYEIIEDNIASSEILNEREKILDSLL